MRNGYKRCYMKELCRNRPWKYIPAVVSFMKRYPYKKGDKMRTWLRNCLYINWQPVLVEK